MKSNKVLLGLFAGVMAMFGSVVSAQSSSTIREIGPANLGGSVSALVVDGRDANNTTFLAGATTGGLFMRSTDNTLLQQLYQTIGGDAAFAAQTELWHRVPVTVGGIETNLPISSLAQASDNTLFIGTGSLTYAIGSSEGLMSMIGTGLYHLDLNTLEAVRIPGTQPSGAADNFAAFNVLQIYESGNTLYLFAGTNSGLHRWTIQNGPRPSIRPSSRAVPSATLSLLASAKLPISPAPAISTVWATSPPTTLPSTSASRTPTSAVRFASR